MISFLVFSAGMARNIRSKKPVPAKPWKKLIWAGKGVWSLGVQMRNLPFTYCKFVYDKKRRHNSSQYVEEKHVLLLQVVHLHLLGDDYQLLKHIESN